MDTVSQPSPYTSRCICAACSASFTLTSDDFSFLNKVSPTIAGIHHPLPPPKLCPLCRRRRRLAFRNERFLYRGKCGLCKCDLLTRFSPDKNQTAYCNECWWSDRWNALDYGRDVDFERSFIDQFSELLSVTPLAAVATTNNENCQFINQAANCKNSYLIFDSNECRECYYGVRINSSANCVDCLIVEHSELAYECCLCTNVYNAIFCQDCTNCSDCAFLYDCIGCKNCLLSTNLRNQEYCIENRRYSREEYAREAQKLRAKMSSYSGLQSLISRFTELQQTQAWHQAVHNRSSENIRGDYLYNCHNMEECFQCGDTEDARYCVLANHSKDIGDCNSCYTAELAYECDCAGLNTYRTLFCDNIWPGNREVLYSTCSPNSNHLFGCSGLKRAEYCILNKQYSKDDYARVTAHIIKTMRERGEWGEFFPPSISFFGYNETVANEYFPLSRDEALQKGFRWCDYQSPRQTGAKELSASLLPDSIAGNDAIIDHVIVPAEGRPFRITTPEFKFYQTMGLPLPRIHSDDRHRRRLDRINPRQLWDRECAKCTKVVPSSLPPQRKGRVVCEECYQSLVV